MPGYLVEVYQPRAGADAVEAASARARAAVEEMALEGVPVRYVRAIFLPADETCFHMFDSVSVEAVEKASRRAGLDHDRIVAAGDVGQARDVHLASQMDHTSAKGGARDA
jgi:hypothetical protein